MARAATFLESVLRDGRFREPGLDAEVQGRIRRRDFAGALALLEAGGDEDQPALFWIGMAHASRHVGDQERATRFYERYAEMSGLAAEEAVVASVLQSTCSVREGMARIVAHHAAAAPSPLWDGLADLPIDEDLAAMRAWMAALLTDDPPLGHIAGLCLLLPEADSGLSLAGVRERPTDSSWPLGSPSWEPERGRTDSLVLTRLEELCSSGEGRELSSIGRLSLPYAGLALRWLVGELPAEEVLGERPERVLGVRYDDGDGYVIGTATRRGVVFDLPVTPQPAFDVRSIKRPVAEIVPTSKVRTTVWLTTRWANSSTPFLATVPRCPSSLPRCRALAMSACGRTWSRRWAASPVPSAQRPCPTSPGWSATLRHSSESVRLTLWVRSARRQPRRSRPSSVAGSRMRSPASAGRPCRRWATLAQTSPLRSRRSPTPCGDPDSTVRMTAAVALKVLHDDAHAVTGTLRDVAADEDEEPAIRRQAATAVRLIEGRPG